MATSMDSRILAESAYAFAADLYETINLSTPATTNILISPLTVHMAIGLALMGAAGKTADEIVKGLQLTGADDPAAIADAFANLIAPLSKTPMIKITNQIHVHSSYCFRKAFAEKATDKFQSQTNVIDFGQSDSATNAINQSVEQQTNNAIRQVMAPGSLGTNTRLVLVNAIHFKGLWVHKFDVRTTVKQKFYDTETTSVKVDMMHMEGGVPLVTLNKLDAMAVQLKYKDSPLSMIVVLPNKRTGLAELDAQLKNADVALIARKMRTSYTVKVSLPKFRVEFAVSLKDTLEKMGMATMFSAQADFSGMIEESEAPIAVSEVVHKAVIEVNEEGTDEAVTPGNIMAHFALPTNVEFVADHPFHYFIVKGANVVLFSGSFRNASG